MDLILLIIVIAVIFYFIRSSPNEFNFLWIILVVLAILFLWRVVVRYGGF